MLGLVLIMGCNSEPPTQKSDYKYAEVELSSLENTPGYSSLVLRSSEDGSLSSEALSSENNLLSSYQISNSLSSSSIGISEGSSFETSVELAILFKSFPIQTVAPGSSFGLEWISSGSADRLAALYISVNKGGFEVLAKDLKVSDFQWTLNGIKNGDRVQLKVGIYEPMNLADTLWDQTGVFDIHSGGTLLKYNGEVKAMVDMYCVECHGGTSTKGGYKISDYSSLVKGNNEKYAVNRMSLIKDMPPLDYKNQPDSLERWQLRDWVLGGSPQ